MDKILVRKGHVKEDLLKFFTSRDSYKENPHIVRGTYSNLPYHECVGLAEGLVEDIKKSHDKDFIFRCLDRLEALEYRMDDLCYSA